MNTFTKRVITVALSAVCLIGVVAGAAQPGSLEDPIVSKTYLDTVLVPYINKTASFSVVNVPSGKTLIGDAGCELILRMGTASVVATEKGGLCDTTIGGDWPNGSTVLANHNLIVPVSDGRGIKADTDIILMVKGSYSIN